MYISFKLIGTLIRINIASIINKMHTVNKKIGHSWNAGQSASTIIAIPREMVEKYGMKNSDIVFEDTGSGILIKKLEI